MKLKLIFYILTFQMGYISVAQQHINSPGAIADSIHSEILNEMRQVYVKIPESYQSNNEQKYPVAYIVDGEFILTTVELVQSYYSGGFMPEMILVGIFNDKHRNRDLTTSEISGMNRENGKAENFIQFIERELIPYIEQKYPATSYRTLIGHSYGGLFTVNALLKHTELFENYLAIDPSLDWDDQKLLEEAGEILKSKDFSGKTLFMSLGGQLHMMNSEITIDNVMEDESDFTLFPRSNIMFKELLEENEKNGLNFGWKFYPQDLHGTISLPSTMDGLIEMFQWFQMENTAAINSPETSVSELLEIIKHREKKLKDHFGYKVAPYPEDLLNMSGYMNMDMEQMEKSKMYFDLAVEYFPKSANVYDSRADYYLSQKEYKKALEDVQKAFEISQSDYHKQRIKEVEEKL